MGGTLPTTYIITDYSGRTFMHILSDKKDAIRAAVIGGVESWLDEILYVPRDELKNHPSAVLKIEIRT